MGVCGDARCLLAQLADPQLGMLTMDESWEEEKDTLAAAVTHINRLQPRFVVVVRTPTLPVLPVLPPLPITACTCASSVGTW